MAGKDNSTWRHDWIPTNMQAAILKAHGSKKGATRALRAPLRKMTGHQLEQHYERPDVGNSGHAVKAVLGELSRRESKARSTERAKTARTAAKDAHATWLEGQFVSAENTTRGNMVNKRGRAAGIDGRNLFTANAATRSAYASDELKSYWDKNPVMSAGEFAAYQRGSTGAAVRHARSRSQRRTFGVY